MYVIYYTFIDPRRGLVGYHCTCLEHHLDDILWSAWSDATFASSPSLSYWLVPGTEEA